MNGPKREPLQGLAYILKHGKSSFFSHLRHYLRSMGSPTNSVGTGGAGSGSGSGQTSLLAALAAERDAALELEAAESAAAERVAREFRGLFDNIPRVRRAQRKIGYHLFVTRQLPP